MAKRHFTDLQCKETVYLTPDELLRPVRDYFGGVIPLDPATEISNPTAAAFFCTAETLMAFHPEDPPRNWAHDGLDFPWHEHDGVFVNPPYGRELRTWCEKIAIEADKGVPIVALLPAGPRFGTRYFQRFVFVPQLDVSCFVRGRVKFLRPDGSPTTGQNPYDSVFYGFNVDPVRFAGLFGHLGRVVKMDVLC